MLFVTKFESSLLLASRPRAESLLIGSDYNVPKIHTVASRSLQFLNLLLGLGRTLWSTFYKQHCRVDLPKAFHELGAQASIVK